MTRCCGNSPRAVTTASSLKGEPPDLAAGQTDKHIDAVPDLVERVRNEISKSLPRFASESAGCRFTSATNTPIGAATNSGLRGQRVVWCRHCGEVASCDSCFGRRPLPWRGLRG